GGPIRVRTGIEQGRAFAMIEDAGPGIAPEQRKRVFERFYRVPNSPSADGCGIGLAIVQAVVDMHRAQVELDRSDLGGLRAVVRFAPTQSVAARLSTSLPTAPTISIAP
ncbi:MAG TPA: sensor histidine kinase, partial [Burkholderiaceae bacterium]|nr:sensor histidine kinase [Burkholderiaceae bacterium]